MTIENQTQEQVTEESVTPTENHRVENQSETEQNTDTANQQQEQPKPKKDWVAKRFGEMTRQKYEMQSQLQAAQAEIQKLRQTNESGQQQQFDPQSYQQQVQQEALRIAHQQSLSKAADVIYKKGSTEFQDFDESIDVLQATGVLNPQFVEAVSEFDAPEKIIHALGQDPELAERIARMNPLQQGRELARLEAKVTQSKPQISNAPPPVKTLNPSFSPSFDPEKASMDDYVRARREAAKR